MEIDHLIVPVTDYERAKRFYAQVLEPLGFGILLDWLDERRAYLGIPPAPSSLWLVESDAAGTLEIAVCAPAAVLCELCDEEFPKDREAASGLIERFRRQLGHPRPRLEDSARRARRA